MYVLYFEIDNEARYLHRHKIDKDVFLWYAIGKRDDLDLVKYSREVIAKQQCGQRNKRQRKGLESEQFKELNITWEFNEIKYKAYEENE